MAKVKGDLTIASGKPSGFYELAKAHVATHGGEWFVIDRKKAEQRQQWRAWIAYAAWLDDQTIPRGKKAATWRSLERITVPTAWPIDFDASAPPAPLAEPCEEPLTPERRRALAAMLRQAVAHVGPEQPRDLGFKPPRSPADAAAARQHFEAHLPELKAEYETRPATLSARAREAFRPPQITEEDE